jgi:hypothetical protein
MSRFLCLRIDFPNTPLALLCPMLALRAPWILMCTKYLGSCWDKGPDLARLRYAESNQIPISEGETHAAVWLPSEPNVQLRLHMG